MHRPVVERELIYVRVVDQRKPGVIVRVRVFDANRLTLLREG